MIQNIKKLPYVQTRHYGCCTYEESWQQLRDDELVETEEELNKRIDELQHEAEYQYHAFHYDRE